VSPHALPLRGSLPPKGADPAWGGPATDRWSPHTLPLRGPFDKLRTDGLPPKGADPAWGGPATDRVSPHTPMRKSARQKLQ
jgi:lactoylglutathione lyase